MSFFASLLLLLSLDTVWAQRRIVEVHKDHLCRPATVFHRALYAFYNEQFELGVGGVYGVSGYPQPQASWVLSAIGSIQVKQKRHACELHCQPG
jgi:hypothetical protein